jgi:glycogen synthase
MQICLYSGQFFPVVGGIAQVSYTLASHWVQQGHKVVLITDTPEVNRDNTTFSFPVIRCPNSITWSSLLNQSDVILSNGYSLRHLVVWLSSRKPIFWIHPIYIPNLLEINLFDWRSLLKPLVGRALLPLATSHIYVSCAMQRQIGSSKGVVIYNPVEDRFRPLPDLTIENDFAFFGRMDHEKGVDILLNALALCHQKGKFYQLDLYGQGPYLEAWKKLAISLGIESQIRWYPFLRGEPLVKAMNKAGVVVVPSRWAEPMGIVAVEAMACGKVVIGSRQGGLGEVLEGYGITFENGNAQQLAEYMMQVQEDLNLRKALESKALTRAKDFAIDLISEQYLKLFESALKPRKKLLSNLIH